MKSILTIARAEILSVFRNRVLTSLIILFLASSVISIYAGSSTIRTEIAAFKLAAQLRAESGVSALPVMPEIAPLHIMNNSIDYVLMVGALLAIFLGYGMVSEDYRDKTLHIILSRRVYRDQYISGKIAGGVVLLSLLHWAAFMVELILLGLAGTGSFGIKEAGLLVFFHLIAIVYMSLFLLLSGFFSVVFLRSLPAFLTSVSIWLGLSYVIPEIGRSVRTYLLASDPAGQTVQSTLIPTPLSDAIQAISPAYHFRNLGDYLFSGLDKVNVGFPLFSLFLILILPVLVGAGVYLSFNAKEIGSNA